MLEKLEILELDLEIQYCNGKHCYYDCTIHMPDGTIACNSKWSPLY